MFYVSCFMMRFDIVTIFPEIFDSYFKESILSRAQKKKLVKINVHNLRDWTTDKHKTVDDKPYGGGIGMVMKIEPIFRAVTALKKFQIQNSKTILFTPRGKKFNQKMAYQFSKLDQMILLCGRYEGIDERAAKYIVDQEISIGDYDLMGGELPAMVVIEAISRLIPGVIESQLLKERIPSVRGRGGRGFIEYPQYTRPEVFSPAQILPKVKIVAGKPKLWRVPKILLSGNHKKIQEWRKKHQKTISS